MQTQAIDVTQVSTVPAYPVGTRYRLMPGELARYYYNASVRDGTGLTQSTLASALLGEHELVYVKNDESATNFAYGDCVVVDVSGTDPYFGVKAVVGATTGVSTPGILGFAGWAIAFGSYGWIISKGITYGRADSTSADQQGDFLTTYNVATAGCVKTGTLATEEEVACMAGYGVTSAAATIGARFLLRCNL